MKNKEKRNCDGRIYQDKEKIIAERIDDEYPVPVKICKAGYAMYSEPWYNDARGGANFTYSHQQTGLWY